MSIVTLKRKTQAKYNNMSVSPGTFSLNGTRRSLGYIGQTSTSRSNIRSLRNGPFLRGHGGCCSTGMNDTLVQNGSIYMNDDNIVKKSSGNTKGMLSNRLKGKPIYVKPDSIRNNNTQSDYTNKLNKKCCNITSNVNTEVTCCDECNVHDNLNIVKSQEINSSSSYIKTLNSDCIINDKSFISTNILRQPFNGFT